MKTFITIVTVMLFIIVTILVDYSLLYIPIGESLIFGTAVIVDILLAINFSLLNDYLLLKLNT